MGKVLILLGVVLLMMGVIAVIKGGLVWARIRNRTTVGIAMVGAAVLLIGGCVATPQASTNPAGPSQPIGAATSSASAGTSTSVAVSRLSNITSVMPPRMITPLTGAGPDVAQQASVTGVTTSRALARLIAAAKAKASRVAAARASSSSAKSSAAHAAQVSSQQSAAAASESARSSASRASSSAAAASAASASSESSLSSASSASAAATSQTVTTSTTAQNAGLSLCGAPVNPYGYSYCGSGSVVISPPADICTYFKCIPYFLKGKGFMEECRDGMVSMSGGRRGACSYHGGELMAVSS